MRTSTPETRTEPLLELFVILAFSAVSTVPLMTSMGSDAGTVTLTARYSLSTVSVTGTVAVVLVSARAPSERQSARARMSAPVRLAFKCLPPFKE